MATYSAFFSSGLRSTPPPSSPVVPDIVMDDVCFDFGSMPSTPPSSSSSMTNVGQDSTNVPHRPILRKRRSSLTLGSGPISSIKSPVRCASVALQRHYSTMSVSGNTVTGGTRSRSGSNAGLKVPNVNAGESSKTRSRSDSVGAALRPRGKSVRRAALPPPSAPLPPVPSMPSIPVSAPPNKQVFNTPHADTTPATPERVHSRAYSSENGYRICEESP